MRGYVIAALLLLVLCMTVGLAWKKTFRMKVVPAEAKVFSSEDGRLFLTVSQTSYGWEGNVLESFALRGGAYLGFGTFKPTHEKRELRIWHVQGEGCREIVIPDQSVHSLYAVADRLLLTRGDGLDEWTGSGFEPLAAAEQAELDAGFTHLRDAEESSEWNVKELDLFEPGTIETGIGVYVVRTTHTEPRSGAFYDDVIELQLLTGRGEVLCSLKESRGLWRRVAAAEFRQIFGQEARIPYPSGT